MKDDRLYLIYIGECIKAIEDYTTGGRQAFLTDRKTQDAVLRNLHTLSESVQRLSDALRLQYPDVEWADIIRFRNVVVHDYLAIDARQIWDIVDLDLPDLKLKIEAILKEMG